MHRARSLIAAAAGLLLGACAGYYPPAAYPGGSYGNYGDYGSADSYPQGYPAGQQGLVRCESDKGNLRRCAVDTRGGVRLSRQLSRTDCVLGRNWGYDAGGIWVNGGCRAEFALGGYGGYDGGGAYGNGGYYGSAGAQHVIRCESKDGRERHCAASLRGAALQRQLSRAPCVQGRNWRWDRGGIWVKEGCRADFAVW